MAAAAAAAVAGDAHPILADISGGAERFPVPVYNTIDQALPPSDFHYAVRTALPEESFIYPGCCCKELCRRPGDSSGAAHNLCHCLSLGRTSAAEQGRDVRFLHHESVSFRCGPQCACPPSCPQRYFELGMLVPTAVVRTAQRGWGLVAAQALSEGAVVGCYVGELLSPLEAAARMAADQSSDDGTYLLTCREETASRILRTQVDARLMGNACRFINHSCEPNLAMTPVRCGSFVPLPMLVARRPIAAGEELFFDYANPATADDGTAAAATALSARPCFCGAATCRGFLPRDPTPGPGRRPDDS